MAQKGRYVYEWPRPMVTVDAVVFGFFDKRVKILLIKRGSEPFKGKWAIPGGFIEMDEDLRDSAIRELEEETGLAGVELEQLHTFGTPGRDPRGRQVSVAFWGTIANPEDKVRGGDDASHAEWIDINEIPKNMAFDHNKIISMAINRLKHHPKYTSKLGNQ